MLVPRVHSVVIRCSVFYMICSLFVFDIIGDQIVHPYSRVFLIMTVQVLSSVSLDFSQYVVVRAFSRVCRVCER